MKKSKILILTITLSFPVILYLFLRSYGQNEFALPIFFEEQEKLYCQDSTLTESDFPIFSLNQSDTFEIKDVYKAEFKVIHFPNMEDSEIQTKKNELNRVLNTFDDLSIDIISLQGTSSKLDSIINYDSFLSNEKAKSYLYAKEKKDVYVNCLFAFPTEEWNGKHPAEETISIENTLVLLDQNNRIRGYYDGYETKEVDRLILEIRVLLSNK